jgi:hypothetical protein
MTRNIGWHHELNLDHMLVPLGRCVSVSCGAISDRILRTLKENAYEQAPVLNDAGEVLGVIERVRLELLYSQKASISEADPEIDPTRLPSKVNLGKLLDVLSERRAAIVERGGGPAGLLTISDLNKHPVRSVLYLILAELEMELASLIADVCPDPWEWLPTLSRERQVRVIGFWEVTKRFDVNADTGPLSACMLTDLISVLAKTEKVRTAAGYRNSNEVYKPLSRLAELRNKVMHPVSPLVLGIEDVRGIKETISHVIELGSRLGARTS